MIANNSLKKGKVAEYSLVSSFLSHDFEVYLPVVDIEGIDLIVKTPSGRYLELQVKARMMYSNTSFIVKSVVNLSSRYVVCFDLRTLDFYVISGKEVIDCCLLIGKRKIKWYVIFNSFLSSCNCYKNEKGISLLKKL